MASTTATRCVRNSLLEFSPFLSLRTAQHGTLSAYTRQIASVRIPTARNCRPFPNAHKAPLAIQAPQHRTLSTSSESLISHHNEQVKAISTSVRSFYENGEKFRINHGSTNSTRHVAAKGKNLVDISALSNVLSVDVERKTALVEPNVPMDRLVEATMRYGLVPPVVMEFPGITVGGGYAGTAGESSSFKHGFFNKTINYVEMVLANGEVVKVSETERPDLFHGAAGAVGTFGVTTMVEIQLHDATKYVETTYHPVDSMSSAIEALQKFTKDPEMDYVDGIMFSKTEGAIVTGRMTNELGPNTNLQCFSDAKDPWFYLHVQEKTSNSSAPTTEAIPLAEYLFRYDRGGFWVGASAFDYFKFPFNAFTRWWLDDFLHTRMMYTALDASGQSKKYVVQDLALPYETAENFVDYTHETFNIYPLWLCPLKQSALPTMHPHNAATEADGKTLKPMLNIGLWGFGPQNHEEFITKNKDLERKLKELGGMKWLYAHTYYSEAEFWEMFDREWYENLRERYDAKSLPSVYEKVKVDIEKEKQLFGGKGSWWKTMWPFAGFYGIKKAIESKTYIAARAAEWRKIDVDRIGEKR